MRKSSDKKTLYLETEVIEALEKGAQEEDRSASFIANRALKPDLKERGYLKENKE